MLVARCSVMNLLFLKVQKVQLKVKRGEKCFNFVQQNEKFRSGSQPFA